MTSDTPTEPTRRRLPRFKLSTILVLVGIAAVAMALGSIRIESQALLFEVKPYPRSVGVCLLLSTGMSQAGWSIYMEVNDTIFIPALALTAFLAWKLIVARRNRPAATR